MPNIFQQKFYEALDEARKSLKWAGTLTQIDLGSHSNWDTAIKAIQDSTAAWLVVRDKDITWKNALGPSAEDQQNNVMLTNVLLEEQAAEAQLIQWHDAIMNDQSAHAAAWGYVPPIPPPTLRQKPDGSVASVTEVLATAAPAPPVEASHGLLSPKALEAIGVKAPPTLGESLTSWIPTDLAETQTFAVQSAVPAGLGALVGWLVAKSVLGAVLGGAGGAIAYAVVKSQQSQ